MSVVGAKVVGAPSKREYPNCFKSGYATLGWLPSVKSAFLLMTAAAFSTTVGPVDRVDTGGTLGTVGTVGAIGATWATVDNALGTELTALDTISCSDTGSLLNNTFCCDVSNDRYKDFFSASDNCDTINRCCESGSVINVSI